MSKAEQIRSLVTEFYPYAKKQLGFDQNCKVEFINNCKNATNPLGETAHYDPSTKIITVFITNRLLKDILRSFSHELVHHAQNCRGEFQGQESTNPGYAQKDEHLRNMEKEAYLKGNIIFRDFEDSKKEEENETIYSREKTQMKKEFKFLNNWKDRLFEGRHEKLMGKLFEDQGIQLKEEQGLGLEELAVLYVAKRYKAIGTGGFLNDDAIYDLIKKGYLDHIRTGQYALTDLGKNTVGQLDADKVKKEEVISLLKDKQILPHDFEEKPRPMYVKEEEEESSEPELVQGGLGDNKPDSDFDPEQLAKGMEVEKEHTNNPEIAKEIAKDHLTEDPHYYVKLAKMEAEPKEESMENNEENTLNTPEDKTPIHVSSPEEKAIRRHDDKLRKLPQHQLAKITEIITSFLENNKNLVKEGKITKEAIINSLLPRIKK